MEQRAGRGRAQILLSAFILGLFCALAPLRIGTAHADTNADVANALTVRDVYVSNALPPAAHLQPGDQQRLQQAVTKAQSSGVSEKIALVSHFPANQPDTYAAARSLRTFLDFHGVLVMVSPRGLGVTSENLTLDEIRTVERKSVRYCLSSYASCAVMAAQLAASQVKSNEASANRSAATFWLVVLVILGAVIAFVVWRVSRLRARTSGNLAGLRTAASDTLSLADTAVNDIEAAGTSTMAPDVRAEYDRALALRDGARVGLDRATTPGALTQANEDAAHAVLALQGVTRKLGIQNPLANPLDKPQPGEHRCFYCGRTDRPPYAMRTIDDGKGNSMEIEVCAVDLAEMERGRTPQIQTVQYNGAAMPWWAVPNNPYYYSYGGPSWQYWLPFMIGMDVGGWFDGGWGPAYGDAGLYGVNSGGYAQDQVSADTVNPATDQGAGDFGGWADSGSAGESGGWGGDSGGWGGDSGGGDFGGGDPGGGDSGGW